MPSGHQSAYARKLLYQQPVDSNPYTGTEILDIFGQKQFVCMVEVFKSLGNFLVITMPLR